MAKSNDLLPIQKCDYQFRNSSHMPREKGLLKELHAMSDT